MCHGRRTFIIIVVAKGCLVPYVVGVRLRLAFRYLVLDLGDEEIPFSACMEVEVEALFSAFHAPEFAPLLDDD